MGSIAAVLRTGWDFKIRLTFRIMADFGTWLSCEARHLEDPVSLGSLPSDSALRRVVRKRESGLTRLSSSPRPNRAPSQSYGYGIPARISHMLPTLPQICLSWSFQKSRPTEDPVPGLDIDPRPTTTRRPPVPVLPPPGTPRA